MQVLPLSPVRRWDGLRLGAGKATAACTHGALRCRESGSFGTPALRASDDHRAAWKALNWRSPWEHRAPDRRQRRTDATDFTTDQGPEVEETEEALCRPTPFAGRDDKAQTTRPTARGQVSRWPGSESRIKLRNAALPRFTGKGWWSGARLEDTVDAGQLLWRGKLRRV